MSQLALVVGFAWFNVFSSGWITGQAIPVPGLITAGLVAMLFSAGSVIVAMAAVSWVFFDGDNPIFDLETAVEMGSSQFAMVLPMLVVCLVIEAIRFDVVPDPEVEIPPTVAGRSRGRLSASTRPSRRG